MNTKSVNILWGIAGCLTGLAIVAANPAQAAGDGIARGPTASHSIAFSNSYTGSDFRKVMVRNWQEIAAQAQKDGLIREAPVVSANNSAASRTRPTQCAAPDESGERHPRLLQGRSRQV